MIKTKWHSYKCLLGLLRKNKKKPPTKQLNYLEVKHMRILKGYSKDEQKELENAKKYMGCSDLLHIITDFISGTRFNLIWEKYNEAEPDKQSSIIRDILDFYTDKATFIVPRKYYVHFIKGNESSYLNRTKPNGLCMTCYYQPDEVFQTEFTEQEIKAIDPRYMAFAIPVEEDNE